MARFEPNFTGTLKNTGTIRTEIPKFGHHITDLRTIVYICLKDSVELYHTTFNLDTMERNPHFPKRFLSMTFILLLLITSNLLGLNNKMIENFESLVMGWDECINYLVDNEYELSLSNYYADEVNYYGKIMSKSECIEQKKSYILSSKNFGHKVLGKIRIEYIGDNIRCSFIKLVQNGKTATQYPAYLQFQYIQGKWLIVEESDLITEAVLNDKPIVEKGPVIRIRNNHSNNYEYIWVEKPMTADRNLERFCLIPDSCFTVIHSSDPKRQKIVVDPAAGGTLYNLGDLDNDGIDDVGFLPSWFSSQWRTYFAWRTKNGQFKYLTEPFTVTLDLMLSMHPPPITKSEIDGFLNQYTVDEFSQEIKINRIKISD
ncbi:hypothetical protein KUV50_17050 [Membranicola marinus]|uniref:Uncharacterized protein n=1 Tax=Membranihabitans marinus TaxID=1227546 RepID=A0A953LAE8_9BACT|nr:hypothetical protein [Membranihabitans marinus]MBY5959865.1 hypothetical protein [Membranihabitans marinus]